MSVSYKNFVTKLSNQLEKNKRLEKLLTNFQIYYNLIPRIGVEIEFYLSPNICLKEFEVLAQMNIKKEKGNNQYEIDLPPTTDFLAYIDQISNTYKQLITITRQLKGNIDFSPKPFLNDYGSSMHFHIDFIGVNNHLSIELVAQAICYYMLDSFLVFMPNKEDYFRLDKNFMAPVNVSFGSNNRSVAVRIPDSQPKRIEHRLASPETNIYIAMFTILNSIFLGLKSPSQVSIYQKIYGNAFDKQYNLTPFPTSPEESFKLFKKEFFL